MPNPRTHPYISATWLPRLLTGEKSCEWAIWFKANYQNWTRLPSNFDQIQWLLEHTNLLNEQKLQWQDRGHEVYVESQNSFRLEGQTATLAGRPEVGRNHEQVAWGGPLSTWPSSLATRPYQAEGQ